MLLKYAPNLDDDAVDQKLGLKFLKSSFNKASLEFILQYITTLVQDINIKLSQLYASCLSNWTVRIIKLALLHLNGFFSASNLEVEYINLSNSLYHCHILLQFC